MKNVEIYDTTLRDGAQGEGISFTLAAKLRIAEKLDQLGVHCIEGGWPGSNPKDMDFFEGIRRVKLKNSRIAAFGSTRRKDIKPEDDTNLRYLLAAHTPVVTIFGKSWLLHVHKVLHTTPEENLRMIEDSIRYLRKKGKELVFDAEHFFDGYKEDPEYAIKTLQVAEDAGARIVVLCDTNGGTLPVELMEIIKEVKKHIRVPFGVHIHNDSGVAVANSIIAVELGAIQVQGTINGFGERCGNADLCSIIPNIKLKLGIDCISDKQLTRLVEVSRFVDELANQRPNSKLPYVGESAFAHKGGMHIDAVGKITRSFEHIEPQLVGNERKILISELSGKTTIRLKAAELGIDFSRDTVQVRNILDRIKRLEHEGYEFETAEGSFELLLKKALRKHRAFFQLLGYRTIVERKVGDEIVTEATVKLNVNGEIVHTVAEGDGPVHALDNALRKALVKFYPVIKKVTLVDYKVRVLDPQEATAAKVRVLIQSTDGKRIWGTVGVSENIIEASWEALVDSIEYKLLRVEEGKE